MKSSGLEIDVNSKKHVNKHENSFKTISQDRGY